MAAKPADEIPEMPCQNCNKDTKLKCPGCKMVYYCCTECMLKDTPAHRSYCTSQLTREVAKVWIQKHKVRPEIKPGNKLALVARAPIKSGELVLNEYNIYSAPFDRPANKFMKANWKVVRGKVPLLFHALKPFIEKPETTDYSYVDQVIRRLGYYEKLKHGFFYGLATSFIRHACQPNCLITPITGSEGSTRLAFRIVALRDIACNEEITIAYHDTCVMGTRTNRRAQLKGVYGMDCVCPHCIEGEQTENNEARRMYDVKVNNIRMILEEGIMTVANTVPVEITKALDDLEECARVIYPADEYSINLALHNAHILRIKINKDFGYFDKPLIQATMKEINLLQSQYSPLYLEFRDIISTDSLKEQTLASDASQDGRTRHAAILRSTGEFPAKV